MQKSRKNPHATNRGDSDHASSSASATKKKWYAAREVMMVIIVAIAISALVKTFLIQSFWIPSGSMEDTLQLQDRIFVSKLVPKYRSLNRGDIVVFKDFENWLQTEPENDNSVGHYIGRALSIVGLRPDDSNQYLIKRIIGLPGDHVTCCDSEGHIVVNGQDVDEPYIKPGSAPSDIPFSVIVPQNHIWVMGDNRAGSLDSRAHMNLPSGGFVPIDQVAGRAFVVIWPYEHWKRLNNTDAFSKVPQPRS